MLFRDLAFVLMTGRDRPPPPSGWLRVVLATAALALFIGDVSLGWQTSLPGAAPFLLAVLHALPGLLARWPLMSWRLAVAGTVCTFAAAATVETGGGLPWTPGMFIYLPIIVLVVARLDRTKALIAGVSTVLVAAAAGITAGIPGVIAAGFAVAIGLLLGRQQRLDRQLDLVTRAVAAEQTRRAVLEERNRIAGELHDVIAHHLTLITVRAETAPYRLPDLGEPAREELTAMGDTAREALAEARSLLNVLREADAEPDLAPQPGLTDLETLVADARTAGVPVNLSVSGAPVDMSDTAGRALYRVLQEALSNARRHAPGAAVAVDMAWSPAGVAVTIENGPGNGLIGMRERMSTVGGELSAAARADGGFEVTATVPAIGNDPK